MTYAGAESYSCAASGRGSKPQLARTEREKPFPADLNTCPLAAPDDYAPILRIRTIGVSSYLSTSTQWR
jgi:hypothetical protein